MKKFTCPHCGEPTFTPIQKALAGSMRSRGKPCPKCGRRCCNGMSSIYFSSVVWVLALGGIVYLYLTATERVFSSIMIAVIIVAAALLCFIFDMFFGKLAEPIRIMS